MATNEVGTAYVVIRAITDKAKDDIKKAFSDGFKNTDADSAASGRRSGKIFGEAFKAGLAEARIGAALDTTFHKAEASAAAAGDRAGAAYARAYRSRVESETRNVGTPTLNNPNSNTGPSSEEQAAEDRARRAARAQADAEDRRARRAEDEADREAARDADRDRDRVRSNTTQRNLPRPTIAPIVRNTPAPATTPSVGGGGSDENNRIGNSARSATAALRDMKRTQNMLGDIAPVRMLTAALGMIRSTLMGIIPVALAATAALALQGAVGAVGGLVGGLTQLAGSLLVIPALAVAAAAGIGALVLGLSGISKAYQALTASEKKSGEEGRDWADAHRKALQAVDNAMNGVVVAQHSAATAQQSLTSASESATDAQKDLNQAYQDSARDLRDMNTQLEGSKLSVEGAGYAVQNAALALQKANSTPGTTQLQRNEANLAYKEAVLRLKEQKARTSDLAQDTAKANAEGIDGSKRVVDAKRSERDATQNLANSQFAMTQAVRNVSQAQIALADAQRELNKQTNEASASQKALNEAMANLSPIGQQFVYTLKSLAPAWKEMKFDVQDSLLRGLGDTIVNFSNAQLPNLKTGLSGTATELNGWTQSILGAFSTPDAVDEFSKVFENINAMFSEMAPGVFNMTEAFKNLVTIGSTFLPRLGTSFSEVSLSIKEWTDDTEHVTGVIERSLDVFSSLGTILGGLGRSWGALFNTTAIDPMLEALGGLTQHMGDFLSSTRGQSGITEFYQNSALALETLGPIFDTIFDGLTTVGSALVQFETAGASGITTFLQGIVGGLRGIQVEFVEFGSAVGEIGTMFGPIVALIGTHLGDALATVTPNLLAVVEGLRNMAIAIAPMIPMVADFVATAWGAFATVLQVVDPLISGVVNLLTTLSPVLIPVAVGIGAIVLGFMGFLKVQTALAAVVISMGRVTTNSTILSGAMNGIRAATSAAAGGLMAVATANGRVITTAALGSVTMGRFGSAIQILGSRIPILAAMQTAFVNTAIAAQTGAAASSAAVARLAGAAAAAGVAVRGAAAGLLSMLGGPLGIVMLGATVGMMAWSNSNANAKQKVEEHKAAVQQLVGQLDPVTGAVTEAMLSQTALTLAQDGTLESFNNFKVSSQQVVQAYSNIDSGVESVIKGLQGEVQASLESGNQYEYQAGQMAKQQITRDQISRALAGDKELYAELDTKIKEYGRNFDDPAQGKEYLDGMGLFRDMLGDQGKNAVALADGMNSTRKPLEEAQTAIEEANKALGNGAPAAKKYSDAIKIIGDASADATSKTNALITAMDILNDKPVDATKAEGEMYAAKDASKQAVKDALKGEDTGSQDAEGNTIYSVVPGREALNEDDSINTKSEAGRAVNAALDAEAKAAINNAQVANEKTYQEVLNKTGDTTKALQAGQAAARTVIDETRNSIISSMEALGAADDKANKYADSLHLLPTEVATYISLPGLPSKLTALDAFRGKVRDIPEEKAVVVKGLTAEAAARLDALGYKVENMEDGETKITAITEPAIQQVNDLVFAPKAVDLEIRATLRPVSEDALNIIRNSGPANGGTNEDIWNAAIKQQALANPEYYVSQYGLDKYNEIVGKATGGAVIGPGTGTSDEIPARLSNGEHVFTASDVAKAGGQGAMYRMRESIQSGTMPRFAKGGAVQAFATGGAVTGGGDMGGGIDWNSLVSGASASLRDVGTMFQGTWKQQVLPEWNQLSLGLSTTANTVINPMFEGVGKNLSGMGNMFQSQATGVIAPSWANMAANVSDIQGKVLSPAVSQISQDVTDFASQLTKNTNAVINPTWNEMARNINGAKVAVIDPALRGIQGGMQTTVDSFAVGANAMGVHFDTIRAKTHDPVKWTIDNVINNGIVGAWNSVATTIGTAPLVPFAYMADGGLVTGGEENKDSVPTMLMPGEVVLNKNAVKAAGQDALISFNAANRSGVSTPNRTGVPDPSFKGGHAKPLLPGLAGGGSPEEARRLAPPTGGTVQAGADITTELQQSMWDAVRTAFPNVVLTSGTRYADVGSGYDNHMGQRALDLGGPMTEIARWIYDLNKTQPVEELIHAPLDGWENLKGGAPLNYGAGTDADHYDHVHWAMANMVNNAGKLVSMGTGSGPAGRPNVAAMAQRLVQPVLDNMHAAVNGLSIPGTVGQLPAAIMGTTESAMNAKIAELASKMSASVGGGLVTAKGTGPVVEQVKRAMAPYGWDEGPQWEALDQLIAHESSWNPDIGYSGPVNSDAYGLFQFLSTTWDDVGGEKTSDPYQQAVYGARYIQQRYGDPIGAWAHWQNPPDGNGHWYDNGGVVPPGVTKVVNETGQPEALLNPSQWASVQDAIGVATQVADGGVTNAADGAVKAVIEVATLVVNAANVSINGAVQGAQANVSQAMAAPAASAASALPASNYTAAVNDAVSTATVEAASAATTAVSTSASQERINDLTLQLEDANRRMMEEVDDAKNAALRDEVAGLEAQLAEAYAAPAEEINSPAPTAGMTSGQMSDPMSFTDEALGEKPYSSSWLNNTPFGYAYNQAAARNQARTDANGGNEVNWLDPNLIVANAAAAARDLSGVRDPAAQGTTILTGMSPEAQAYLDNMSPEAREAVNNTYGAAPVDNATFTNIGTDANDPRLDNPNTDPALAGGPTPFDGFVANQQEGWTKWGEDAVKEIGGQFLDPLGLSAPMSKAVDDFGPMLRKAVTQGVTDALIARDNAELGMTGQVPGAPVMPEQIVFNGMDPQKAMDELGRLFNQGMASVSRYRG